MDWISQTQLPFTPDGQIFFSPITGKEVYIIDQGNTNFYKYNLESRAYTQLTPPTYSYEKASTLPHFNRTLAISPDGSTLACISEGWGGFKSIGYHNGGYKLTGGGRRIEFYNIAGDNWSASKQIDCVVNNLPTLARALVWEDDDTLWVWCVEYTSSVYQTNSNQFRGKCVKYTISTDTWIAYTNTFLIMRRGTYYGGGGFTGYCSNSSIKADNSVVYLGGAFTDYNWEKYTIATDTYAYQNYLPGLPRFIFVYDRDKLWYYEYAGTCQQGYVSTIDDSQNDDQFAENTDRTALYGKYVGIADDLAAIIAHARSIPPELMLAWPPQVTTDPALWIGLLSATANGTLDNEGLEPCDCGFEWGETAAYGNTTPTEKKETGDSFSQLITGLLPNTTYLFRAFATNAAGTGYGADRTFITAPAMILPTVTTDPATWRGAIAATNNGTR